jgi:hypothetical protein
MSGCTRPAFAYLDYRSREDDLPLFRDPSYHALIRQDITRWTDLARIGHDQALRAKLTAWSPP